MPYLRKLPHNDTSEFQPTTEERAKRSVRSYPASNSGFTRRPDIFSVPGLAQRPPPSRYCRRYTLLASD